MNFQVKTIVGSIGIFVSNLRKFHSHPCGMSFVIGPDSIALARVVLRIVNWGYVHANQAIVRGRELVGGRLMRSLE